VKLAFALAVRVVRALWFRVAVVCALVRGDVFDWFKVAAGAASNTTAIRFLVGCVRIVAENVVARKEVLDAPTACLLGSFGRVNGVWVGDFGTGLALVWRHALGEFVARDWHLFASWAWDARPLPGWTVVDKVCSGVATFNLFAHVFGGIVRLVLAASAGCALGDRSLVQLVPLGLGMEACQDHVKVALS